MTVAEILVGFPRLRKAGWIVAAGGCAFVGNGRCEDGCAGFEEQGDVTLGADGITGVGAWGKTTVSPPTDAAASMALLMAGLSMVLPSPVAPKVRMSNLPLGLEPDSGRRRSRSRWGVMFQKPRDPVTNKVSADHVPPRGSAYGATGLVPSMWKGRKMPALSDGWLPPT